MLDQAADGPGPFCIGSGGSQGVEAPILVESVDVSFRVR
jgi:hypothetical protein